MVENKGLLQKFLDKYKGKEEPVVTGEDNAETNSETKPSENNKDQLQVEDKLADENKKKENVDQSDTGKKEKINPETSSTNNAQKDPEKQSFDRERKMLKMILEKLGGMGKDLNEKIEVLQKKTEELEAKTKEDNTKDLKERIEKLETTLSEFSSVYEAISSQYNPLTKNKGGASTPQQTMQAGPPSQPTSSPTNTFEPKEEPTQNVKDTDLTVKQEDAPAQDQTPKEPEPQKDSKTHAQDGQNNQSTKNNADSTSKQNETKEVHQEHKNTENESKEKTKHEKEQINQDKEKVHNDSDKKEDKHEKVSEGSQKTNHVPSKNPEEKSEDHKSNRSKLAKHDHENKHGQTKNSNSKQSHNEQVKKPHQNHTIPSSHKKPHDHDETMLKDNAIDKHANKHSKQIEPNEISPADIPTHEEFDLHEHESKKEMIQRIAIEKQAHLYMLSKIAKGQKRFFSQGYEPITNILDLVNSLNKEGGDELFNRHVNEQKDDFRNWIKEALELKMLGNKLKGITNKEKYIFTILKEI